MFGESARLKRLIIVLSIVAASWCGTAVAQTQLPSAAEASSDALDLESRITAALAKLPTMHPNDALKTMQGLLQGDVSKVSPSVQVSVHNALASAYEQLAQEARADKLSPGSERKAETYIDAAVEAYIKAARVAVTAGDMNSATIAITKAVSYRPGNEEALLGMARVHAAAGRHLQAIERYNDYFRATKRGPLATYEPAIYTELGRVYLAAKLWNQALKALKSAVDSGGDTDEVASLTHEAYLGLGKPDKAMEQIQKAITKSPTQPLYHSRYALILWMQNSSVEAEAKAAEAIRIARIRFRATPDDLKLMEVMVECYNIYTRILSSILAANPDQTSTRLALVTAMQEYSDLSQLQSFHKALTLIKMAPESQRDNVELLEKQVTLEQVVRHRDLRKTCERLLRVDPRNKVAKEALAKLDSESGSPASAPAVK